MIDPTSFVAARAPQPLAPDAVHLWLLPLDGGEGPDAARDATARANAFLCDVVGAYVGRALAPDDFVRGEFGKPALRAASSLGFNLTHCAHACLVAIADGVEIGVDVEPLAGRPRAYAALARRYFGAEEADWIAAQPADTIRPAFLALWTAKEAVLKATGRGIAFGLHRLRFATEAAAPGRLVAIDASVGPAHAWQVHALRPAPGLAGAVAWRGDPRRIAAFRHG